MSRSHTHISPQKEAGRLMLWIWDLQTNTVQFSQEIGSNESKENQLDLIQWFDRIHPGDRARITAELITYPPSWQDNFSFLGADDRFHFIHAQAQLWSEGGKPIRMLGSYREVVPEDTPGQNSSADEEYYQFALQSAGVGTWDLDPIRETVRWDERCQELYGFAKGSLVPYTQVLDYIHPEDRSRVTQAVSRAIDPAIREPYDIVFRTIGAEDGRLRWLHCKGKAYFNATHEVYRFSGTAQDVTEQKIKEEVFKGIERKYQSAFISAEVAVAILSTDGFFQLVNPAMAAFTGYRMEELVGQHFQIITPEEEREEDEKLAQELFSGFRKSGTVDKAYVHKDGSLIWGRLSVSLIRSEKNVPVSFVTIIQNVTEEKEAQLALQGSERRFRNLIIDTPTATVVFVGRPMRIEVINDPMLQIWSKAREQVQGKLLLEAMPELEGQPFLGLLQNVYDTGVPYRNPEGKADLYVEGKLQTLWFNFSYNPIYDADGRIYGIINTATDVTAQVAARLQIKEAEENLRSAVDIAQLGTWSYYPQDDRVYFSDRLKAWFGFSGDEITIEDVFNVIHSKDRRRVTTAISAALIPDSGGIYDEEYTIVPQLTGGERVLHARAHTLYTESGEAYLLTGTAQDITPLKQVAEELELQVKERTLALNRMNLDLQQTNANLEQFAYAASHDLQEPLRKIQSFISLIEVHEKSRLSERGVTLLSRIQVASQRMTTLIKDLLSFSQLTSDQLNFNRIELNPLIDEVLLDLEYSIEENQARIEVDYLPGMWGNRQQVAQLLQNLFTNALKFSHPERTIQIRVTGGTLDTSRVIPMLDTDRSYIWLTIQDNGIGFEEEYREKIFQMFQRLHTRDRYEGTGIGLALCRKVVENHRGYIEAHSVLGEGAAFTVYLPAEP